MTDKVMTFGKQLSLAKLSTQVAAEEAALGTLKALGRTADKTAATYARGPSPARRLKLQQKAGESIPPGFGKVCEGTVWIAGQAQAVVAIRKNED